MKKLFFLLCGFVIALSFSVIASPPAPPGKVIVDAIKTVTVSPIVISQEVFIVANVSHGTAELRQPSEINYTVKKESSGIALMPDMAPLYRHYFNHEDNKKYPEYIPDDLNKGFPKKDFKPVK